MNHILVTVFIILGSGISQAQDTISVRQLTKQYPTDDTSPVLHLYNEEVFSGVAVQGVAPNYRVIHHYENGQLHGLYVAYHKNGQLKEKTFWQFGKREGKSVTYYDNGQLQSRLSYINGSPIDTTESWYPNGNMKAYQIIDPEKDYVDQAIIYYKNGAKSYEVQPTFYKNYYEDGTLKEYGLILNNEKNGLVKFYNSFGKLVKKEWWELGELIKSKEKKKK